MPCDSVATINTRISQETFNKALTPQVLLEVLPKFLAEQHQTILSKSDRNNELHIQTEAYMISIYKGQINVSRRVSNPRLRSEEEKMTEAFKNALSEFVKGASLNAVRAKIVAAIQGGSSQMAAPVVAPNGAMILDFNLKGRG